ncbi:hypothetical protein ES707_22298 [subsurface metagenome]
MTTRRFEDLLAHRGEEMNLEISSDQETLIQAYGSTNYFAVAIANAFTWTGHAVGQNGFFESAIVYLSTGNLASLSKALVFSGRFGPERLADALRGWKFSLDQLSNVSQDIQCCGAQELYMIQERCFSTMSQLLDQRQISGIGPWLFCAPFKIVAAHRRELWQSESLDDVWMPLGLEVVRGIRNLIQHRYPYFRGLHIDMLSEEEGGLKEGLGTVLLVQDASKKIAQIVETRVLHINSGLYLHGRGEL